jgi:hypothetical protein
LLIWDSRAKVSPPYEKTARTGSASRALRAEDDPCACRFGYEKMPGRERSKNLPRRGMVISGGRPFRR